MELIPHCLTPWINLKGIRSLIGFGNLVGPLVHSVLYLPQTITRGSPKSDFGENQLSLSLFSLSLLSTAHPSHFQPTPVRAASACYRAFTLAMDRSLQFRVYVIGLNAQLRLAFATAPELLFLNLALQRKSPVHYTKGMRSGAGFRRIRTSLSQLVGVRFQVTISLPFLGYFSPFPHGTSSLSVTNEYLALGSGLPRFPPGSHVTGGTRGYQREVIDFRIQDYHLLWLNFPEQFF